MADDVWLLKYIHMGISICINICKYKLLSFGQRIKNFFQRMTKFPLNVRWNALRTKRLKSDYRYEQVFECGCMCDNMRFQYSVYVHLNICPLIMGHIQVLGLWSMRKEVNTFLVGTIGKQTKTWCQLICGFTYLKSTYNSFDGSSVKQIKMYLYSE